MSPAVLWWIATAMLVLAELTTGTFYLLMVSLGLAGGALAAHAGLALSAQLLTAALVGGAAVVAWHLYRARQPAPPAPGANHDIQLDVGEHVMVTAWDAAGRTHVHYRGADWQARWAGGGPPEPGEHVIRALDGNVLLLGR
ncbi:NfeD family protein [Sphaerotilus microaerophilus]|uniref:Membrane protein n=1 Tax=Sphaerotilus microaerophilus TaxID=2914710 RepID=A0ABN6PNV2_9BURK|nr:NfeD family protein [Sphaerotilus sp. FB-5]BDI05688.1 membrane protein [Sphaerotilus sp. FB-5]